MEWKRLQVEIHFQGFSTGSMYMYFMSTAKPLGDILYIRVWHDNSGSEKERDWYLDDIIIEDMMKQEK